MTCRHCLNSSTLSISLVYFHLVAALGPRPVRIWSMLSFPSCVVNSITKSLFTTINTMHIFPVNSAIVCDCIRFVSLRINTVIACFEVNVNRYCAKLVHIIFINHILEFSINIEWICYLFSEFILDCTFIRGRINFVSLLTWRWFCYDIFRLQCISNWTSSTAVMEEDTRRIWKVLTHGT